MFHTLTACFYYIHKLCVLAPFAPRYESSKKRKLKQMKVLVSKCSMEQNFQGARVPNVELPLLGMNGLSSRKSIICHTVVTNLTWCIFIVFVLCVIYWLVCCWMFYCSSLRCSDKTAEQPSMNDVSSQPKIVQALYNFQPANTDEVRTVIYNGPVAT